MTAKVEALSLFAQREFDTYYRRSYRTVYTLAYRKTGNRDDAEDLTSQAFLRACKAFHTYKREMRFENWVCQILSNLFIDFLRKKPKVPDLSLDFRICLSDDVDDLCYQIPDPNRGPEEQLLGREIPEAMALILSQMAPVFREALLLCDVMGFSYQEIAEKMGSSVGTVRSRIHRARHLLRKGIVTNQ